MAFPLTKLETQRVVAALRHQADHLATTMEQALKELGKDAAKTAPAAYAVITSQTTGANDLRDLAARMEAYGPGAKPGRKPKAAAQAVNPDPAPAA